MPNSVRFPVARVAPREPLAIEGRSQHSLTDDWRFIAEEQEITADTSSWSIVNLPHTWNNLDILPLPSTGKDSPSPTPYMGIGWYARTLTPEPSWRGRRVFLRFEAASLVARVLLNGVELGEHRGGFTAFCYELTPHLDLTRNNDLRVQVSNAPNADIPPLSCDFNIQGGIYRPVHLVVTGPACISPLDDGSFGVYVFQDEVTESHARLTIRTMLSGVSPDTPVEVHTEILDAQENLVVAAMSSPMTEGNDHCTTLTVPSPHRWHGRQNPYRYQARVTLRQGTMVLDRVRTTFGIRTVQITAQDGFLLNGQPYPIYGVNRHQDLQGKGWAMTIEDEQHDLALITDIGATAIRLAHYPQSTSFHDACDQQGFLVWDEVPLVNASTDSPAFTANSEQQLREMVKQLHHHPSVAWWGIYNELQADYPRNAVLLKHLKAVVEALDSTRLIVGATCMPANSMHQVPDWNCWNMYCGWYDKKGPSMAVWARESAEEIGHSIGVSEYGAGGNSGHHQEDETLQPESTVQVFHPEEYQAWVHEGQWASMHNNPDIWGTFIWNMFDFTVKNRNEGGFTGLNDKGLMTYDRRVRKDAFFFYKANWNPEPMLHLTSKRFTVREAALVQVKAYTTEASVTLTVNGVVIGTEPSGQ